jgi:alpha-L-arabinofuranosidase
MNEAQEGPGEKNRLRVFRLWLILAAAIFLILLTATQFLPGGTRSFSDWLPALAFLFAVSLATATVLAGTWWVVRPPFSRRKLRRLAAAFAGFVILIAAFYAKALWKEWFAGSRLPHSGSESTLKEPAFEPRSALASVTNKVRANVDATQVVRTVDARWFGINTAIWDALLDTAETVSALRELDIQILRFGGFSDSYHWADGTFGSNSGPAPTSFFNFMHLATNLGVQAIITVNYGSGTPEEAADWVRCANVTNRCGFKYWEIGNENYGSWERDDNLPPHDPVTYATRAREYIRQMKAVDPSIKIGVVVTERWTERAGVPIDSLRSGNLREFIVEGYQGWTPRMLATLNELGAMPDWVSLHYYPQSWPGHENDARLLQSSTKWAALAAPLRRHLKTCFGAAHTNIEMLCTENNSVSQNTGKQTTSLVNGLYLADSFGQISQTEFNSFLWWDLRNAQDRNSNNHPSLYGWRPYGDHGIMSGNDTRYPTFYAFKLLKFFAGGGDEMVHAASDGRLLSVYAARRADRTLALLVINKSPQTVMNVTFSIAGFQPQPDAKIYSFGIPQDQAASTETGSPDIVQTNSSSAATEFSCAFSPYSATVVILSPRRTR